MTASMNQQWWGNSNKTGTSTSLTCPICPKYNPGKPINTVSGHLELPNGPMVVIQIDFIQLPSYNEYKYVLVIVFMFSHQTEAFPSRQATASSVAKVLLVKIIPNWDNLKLDGDCGTHFTDQVF